MAQHIDVAVAQQALDALSNGDQETAAAHFTDDLVLTGAGGCLRGQACGLEAVLGRFVEIARLTHGTFGTEVEAVYAGIDPHVVIVTRHWASVRGAPVHGTQALLVTLSGDRIRTIEALSRTENSTGIWD